MQGMQGRRPAIRSPHRAPHHGRSPSSSSNSSTSSQLTATNPNASTSTIKLIPPSTPPVTQPSPVAAGVPGFFEPTLIRSQSTQPQLQTQPPSQAPAAYAMQASQRKRSATAPSPTSPPLTSSAISSAVANAAFSRESPPTPPPHAIPHPPPPPPAPAPQQQPAQHQIPQLLNYTPPPAKKDSKMKIFSKPARIGTPALDKALRPPPSPNKLPAISSPMPRLTPSAAAIAAALGAGGERKPSFSSMHSSSTGALTSASTQDLHSQYASFQGYSSSPPAQQKDHSHSHKPHFLRPRRDKDHTFSSSASNSKAISADGSSLYSFGPSSPNSAVFGSSSKVDLQKTITGIDIGARGKGGKGFTGGSSWDDAFLEGFGAGGSGIGQDNAWTVLRSRVLGLFDGEPLRNTVEDLNKLVVLHIKRCYDRRSSGQLLDDVRDLLDTGMLTLDPTLLTLPDERLIPKLVDIWGFLFGNILPYFEAVFLPLQQEFKGTGTLSAKESTEFFGLLPHFDVRRLVLVSFRDNVILPLHARLRILFSKLQLDFSVSQSDITHNASRMLQCISVLSSVLTEDEAQEAIDELAKTLKHNWLTRGRTGRNRRGFVGTKTMRAVV